MSPDTRNASLSGDLQALHDQTLEFVGVLSVAPQLAGFGREEEFTDGIEQTVPYSELPRLHALGTARLWRPTRMGNV